MNYKCHTQQQQQLHHISSANFIAHIASRTHTYVDRISMTLIDCAPIHTLICLSSSLIFVDLISASLLVSPEQQQRKCDENNNSSSGASSSAAAADAEKSSSSSVDNERADKPEEKMMKQHKPMVGLFPLDLRSELKQRVGGGRAGFALKKSSTNIDVANNNSGNTRNLEKSDPIPIAPSRPADLLRKIQGLKLTKAESTEDDDDDDAGVENLSFKEKLQLIERSSSRSLVNPL
jgi:hypothetical protein